MWRQEYSLRWVCIVLFCSVLIGWMSGCETQVPKNESVVDGGATSKEKIQSEPAKETVVPDAVISEPKPKENKPPKGAVPAQPKRYAGGTCPVFKAGSNTIEAEFIDRTFKLFLPPKPKGAPLLFIWHPLGGNAEQMIRSFGAAEISKKFNAIVAVPSSCCSGPKVLPCCSRASEWSFVKDYDVDLSFFDGMLTCLDKQYDIDNRRVYTTGFSAGSLWSSLLVIMRSQYLASAAIFSGGIGFFDYSTPNYKTPLILAWGGKRDVLGGAIDFNKMAIDFEKELKKDKHFVISCDHGGGHTVPRTAASWALPFLFDHTFGDGSSPYSEKGKQKGFPSYCKFP